MSSPAIDERDRIRSAMERILAGKAERSNGALTVVALAIEADVPRNALTQRHLDLKKEFYERITEMGLITDVESRLRETITTLKKSVAAQTKELQQLRTDVPALIRVVNQLTLENQELRQTLTALDDNVIPFRSRHVPRPAG